MHEVTTTEEDLKKSKESQLYKDVPAYSPEKVGYAFETAYVDPDFNSASISEFINKFNSLPTLVIPDSHHDSQGTLRIISPAHGRSTESNKVGDLTLTSDIPEYQAFSVKGNTLPGDMQYVELQFDSATGIRGQGLLMGDEQIISSYPEKCRRIAQAGLPSERIVAVFKATHVPFAEMGKRETWDVARKWDSALREKLTNQLNSDSDLQLRINETQLRTWGGDPTMNSRRSQNLIEEGEIIIFLRAMQVNERVRDVKVATKDDLEEFCKPAMTFVAAQDPEAFQFQPLPEGINYLDFLRKWLPSQMGYHLGSWYRKGFVHGYAHGQNWTLAGTLIDDDSAREKTNFDLTNEAQLKEYQGYQVYDLLRTFEAVLEIFDGLREQQIVDSDPVTSRELAKILYSSLESVLIEYCKVVFPKFANLKDKFNALQVLLDQELPNPHFDPMRDRDKMKTIAVNKLDRRQAQMWGQVLRNLNEKFNNPFRS